MKNFLFSKKMGFARLIAFGLFILIYFVGRAILGV